MELMPRLHTVEDEHPDEIYALPFPCQLCDKEIKDDGNANILELTMTLIGESDTKRYVHPTCLVEAANHVIANGLDLDDEGQLAAAEEVSDILARL